jgi:hypothetical protein
MKNEKSTAAMLGQSATNGWDAICALNAESVNSIFFQQYLQDGPTNPATPLRLILQGENTSFWILDVVAGPPQVSFPTNLQLQQAQVTMFLVRGSLIQFDPNQKVILNALLIQPKESWLTGALSLAKVTGQANSQGQVVVDLASGAYQPQVQGVDPNSVLATELGAAVQTFFANNATKYPLGTIMETGVPACLQPTSFDFVTQPAPESTSGDGCVLLLIQTNGSGGAVGQLTAYPIPSGHTAALIVSNQVIFNQLIPPALTAEFQKIGFTFAGQQSNSVWQAVSTGGSINVGTLGKANTPNPCLFPAVYTSDNNGNAAAVEVPLDGFIIAPGADGSLAVSWNKSWSQPWADLSGIQVRGWCDSRTSVQAAQLTASYAQTSAASVDPATDIVSFSGSGTVSFKQSGGPSWLEKFFSGQNLQSQFTAAIQPTLQEVFNAIQLPSVDTFALANLLFPSFQALSLQQASAPCDLLLNGQMMQTLAVTPSTTTVQPGQTQQFSAMSAGQPVTNVTWEIKPPGFGSINSSGLYTAPSSVTQAQVVVITAVSQSNTNLVGSAMVLVYQPIGSTGLIVSPANLLLTAGQSFNLLVTDESGTPVEATCTLDPNIGQIEQGFTTGQWTYTAPSSVEGSTSVTVKATSSSAPSDTGTATIQLMPTEAVAIAPASQTLTPGQSVQLAASSPDLVDYTWQVYPIGVGSILANDANSAQATYTAPTSVKTPTEVMVAAYSLGDAGVGIGLARITVNPTS